MPFLTILTPTYNRSNTLEKCFESLCKQKSTDFQWLIIDDGSTDETDILINRLKQQPHQFKIDYYYKQNGGKHTALNYSHNYIESDIVLILDSDDYLTENAVNTIITYWDKYKTDKNICGLSFLKGQISGYELKPVSSMYPQDEYRSDHISCCINGNNKGDKCEIIRTDILKEFPFPEINGEKFIGEGYLWVNIACKYETIYINKVLYVCEYLDGGLTKSGRKMRVNNPIGGMIHAKVYMNSKVKFKFKIKNAWLYIAYGFIAKKSIGNILRDSNKFLLTLLNLPFGYGVYLLWNSKYN